MALAVQQAFPIGWTEHSLPDAPFLIVLSSASCAQPRDDVVPRHSAVVRKSGKNAVGAGIL